MILREKDYKDQAVEQIAKEICIAARTAPKTRGVDLIETAILTGEDIKKLSGKMLEIYSRQSREAFRINSGALENCSCVVLIGAKTKTAGLSPCGFCGFKDCAECEAKGAVCSYNPIDLGIALGSAISQVADKRVDNRLMWTVGMAALEMEVFGPEVKMVIGIPLSATGKNVFFDRK